MICKMNEEISQLKKENSELKKQNADLKEQIKRISSSRGEAQKSGMKKKAVQGNLMSRAPFGYEIASGKLIPGINFKEIEEIFEEFLKENTSLRKLAEKHNLSVNGLKKILKNFTYIGKIKFNNEIFNGTHKPIISTTLFNHVHDKLERLGIK